MWKELLSGTVRASLRTPEAVFIAVTRRVFNFLPRPDIHHHHHHHYRLFLVCGLATTWTASCGCNITRVLCNTSNISDSLCTLCIQKRVCASWNYRCFPSDLWFCHQLLLCKILFLFPKVDSHHIFNLLYYTSCLYLWIFFPRRR